MSKPNIIQDPLAKTTPFYPFPATSNPATTQQIVIDAHQNATGHLLWYMNGESFRANYDHPLLVLANQGNTSYPQDPQWNVYNFGNNNSVRVIVKNTIPAAHPMHLHGKIRLPRFPGCTTDFETQDIISTS